MKLQPFEKCAIVCGQHFAELNAKLKFLDEFLYISLVKLLELIVGINLSKKN